jgi:hypothetical protein
MAYPKDRPNPPQHVAHLVVHGTAAGVNWANVFWVRNANQTTPTQNDFQAFVADVATTYTSLFGPHIPIGVTIDGGTGLYWGATEIDLGVEAPIAFSGAAGNEGMPNNTATCISWKVQAHYKGGHPRTYLPPTDIGNRLDGRLYKPQYVDDVQGKANDFLRLVNRLSHGELSDIHLGTVSFVLRKAWRTPPIFRDYVEEAASVDQRIDSMRRRLGRDL